MPALVALFRGINVGTAKSVPMAELASIFERLGYHNVTTVLRSGNVVFSGVGSTADMSASIETALLEAVGVRSSVIVFPGTAFRDIAAANPLLDLATNGSRSFVTFLSSPMPSALALPDASPLAPEVIRVGPRAIYQWIPDGSLQTRVPRSFWQQFSTPVTTRNVNTVAKLATLLA